MKVVSVNVGLPSIIKHKDKEMTTGIYKTSVNVPLFLSKTQLEGDGQADLKYHGGVDKALCVYCEEHYSYWEHKLERNLGSGGFGENVTVRGLLEDEVCIGDTYQLGEAIVQVTQPRQPCHKLAKRYEVDDLAVQVQDTGFTGYYFRVLQEGLIPVNPQIKLLEKHATGVTISFANHIKYQDKTNLQGVQRILAVDALSTSWRESFVKRLAELQT